MLADAIGFLQRRPCFQHQFAYTGLNDRGELFSRLLVAGDERTRREIAASCIALGTHLVFTYQQWLDQTALMRPPASALSRATPWKSASVGAG